MYIETHQFSRDAKFRIKATSKAVYSWGYPVIQFGAVLLMTSNDEGYSVSAITVNKEGILFHVKEECKPIIFRWENEN